MGKISKAIAGLCLFLSATVWGADLSETEWYSQNSDSLQKASQLLDAIESTCGKEGWKSDCVRGGMNSAAANLNNAIYKYSDLHDLQLKLRDSANKCGTGVGTVDPDCYFKVRDAALEQIAGDRGDMQSHLHNLSAAQDAFKQVASLKAQVSSLRRQLRDANIQLKAQRQQLSSPSCLSSSTAPMNAARNVPSEPNSLPDSVVSDAVRASGAH